jgi:hypothetical protein
LLITTGRRAAAFGPRANRRGSGSSSDRPGSQRRTCSHSRLGVATVRTTPRRTSFRARALGSSAVGVGRYVSAAVRFVNPWAVRRPEAGNAVAVEGAGCLAGTREVDVDPETSLRPGVRATAGSGEAGRRRVPGEQLREPHPWVLGVVRYSGPASRPSRVSKSRPSSVRLEDSATAAVPERVVASSCTWRSNDLVGVEPHAETRTSSLGEGLVGEPQCSSSANCATPPGFRTRSRRELCGLVRCSVGGEPIYRTDRGRRPAGR